VLKELKLRSIFVAPKGKVLVSIDLSQAETWVVAYLANEQNMKHSLMYSDIHRDTAMFIDNLPAEQITSAIRFKCKKCNHALSYRMTYMRLCQTINKESDKPPFLVVSMPEARRSFEKWHTLYNLKSWWSQIEFDLGKDGHTLVNPYGNIRTFFGAWGNELFKEATAHLPQSTVADHLNGCIQPELGIPGGLIEVHRQFVKKGVISVVNQSHDSFIAEVPVGIVDEIIPQLVALVRRPLVVNNEQFTIPVDCEVGERWGQLEKRKVA
jgi:hypothetical protein